MRLHEHLAEELRGLGSELPSAARLCVPCRLADIDLGNGAAGPSGRRGRVPPAPREQQFERADRTCREAFRVAFQLAHDSVNRSRDFIRIHITFAKGDLK